MHRDTTFPCTRARAREKGTYTEGKETWALGTKASDIGAAELLARVLLPALGPMLAESCRVPRSGERVGGERRVSAERRVFTQSVSATCSLLSVTTRLFKTERFATTEHGRLLPRVCLL